MLTSIAVRNPLLLNSNELFNQIYETAKNSEDKERFSKLSQLLATHKTIDVTGGKGLFTPASKLAAEGNKAAVNVLLNLGADPDKAAEGAAYGGHRAYAEELRQKYGAVVNKFARCAAQGGDRAYAEELRQKYEAESLFRNHIFYTYHAIFKILDGFRLRLYTSSCLECCNQ